MPDRSIASVEAEYGQTVVALVLNADNSVHDWCFNWESAQSYALSEGYAVKAIRGDGHMTMEECQALYSAEKARYDDCFGITETT